jgi:hypothetical protein
MSVIPTQGQPPDGRPSKPTEQQVNRACEACRLLKVRCLPGDTSTSNVCQRCKKTGRICIYAAPQKRRQRIRTDTRVAELEKEIRAMRSLLSGGDSNVFDKARIERGDDPAKLSRISLNSSDAEKSTPSTLEEESRSEGQDIHHNSFSPTSQYTMPEDNSPMTTQPSGYGSVQGIEFRSLSTETTARLFGVFNDRLAPQYPGVVFEKLTTAAEIRRTKPVLFQAVVTAAACQESSDLFNDLFREMARLYADRIFIRGEKSLELVQSLTLTAVWYCPPDELRGHSKLQFYQYINMAASMALDIGVGMNVDTSPTALDESRCLLSCYIACAGWVNAVFRVPV